MGLALYLDPDLHLCTFRFWLHMVIELDMRIPAVDPIKCITRIANQINLNQKVKQKAINIIHAATKNRKNITGFSHRLMTDQYNEPYEYRFLPYEFKREF
jgi:hypothetical protein